MTIAGPAEEIDRHGHTRPRSAKAPSLRERGRALRARCRERKDPSASRRAREHSGRGIAPGRSRPRRADGSGVRHGDPERQRRSKRRESVPVKAMSLAVAQKCNLGCTYCYAQQGTFGGTAGNMPPDVAKAAIDRLVRGAEPGETLTLAFMGGEPLVNRRTLHASTRYAAADGRRSRHPHRLLHDDECHLAARRGYRALRGIRLHADGQPGWPAGNARPA